MEFETSPTNILHSLGDLVAHLLLTNRTLLLLHRCLAHQRMVLIFQERAIIIEAVTQVRSESLVPQVCEYAHGAPPVKVPADCLQLLNCTFS